MFLRVLRRSEILVVGLLVKLFHLVSAVLTLSRVIPETIHQKNAEKIGRQRNT